MTCWCSAFDAVHDYNDCDDDDVDDDDYASDCLLLRALSIAAAMSRIVWNWVDLLCSTRIQLNVMIVTCPYVGKYFKSFFIIAVVVFFFFLIVLIHWLSVEIFFKDYKILFYYFCFQTRN